VNTICTVSTSDQFIAHSLLSPCDSRRDVFGRLCL